MSLPVGTRFGPYEVTSILGTGGMGEVYRAHDVRLDRDVALKVLPSAVTADPDRLQRFRREAQVLASLNHQNIAAIYGLEQGSPDRAAAPVDALVLELVEGPTLADRIATGPLPLDEARTIGIQIANALEAAHERGIVHRDLKPANIKIRADGTVKVLDFGLAKALDPSSSEHADVSRSPTFTSPAMTGAGVILGTAAYMSPEQARGAPVDKRTDVWAFGCVLFEMLAGRHAFGGAATVSDAIAAVLRGDPDWASLPGQTPREIRALLERCLEKDPRRRLRDIGDAGLLLAETVRDGERQEDARPPSPRKRSGWVVWAAVTGWTAAVLLALLNGWGMRGSDRSVSPRLVVARLAFPLGSQLVSGSYARSFDVSSDGARIVYVGRDSTGSALYLQDAVSGELKRLPETLDAIAPAFSPDARGIGFIAGQTLKVLRLDGGLPRDVTPVRGWEWSWNGNDHIVLGGPDGLMQIPLNGGPSEVVARLGQGDAGFGSACPLPGGAFLVSVLASSRTDDPSRIEVVGPGISERRVIAERGGSATFVAGGPGGLGYIVYADAGRLMALPFDADRRVTRGSAVPMVENVAMRPNGLSADYDISSAGTLTFREGTLQELVWVDRDTGAVRPLTANLRRYAYPRLAPDGKRLAVEIHDSPHQVWMLDLERDVLVPLTAEANGSHNFGWAPDGRSIVYTLGGGPPQLGWIRTDGSRKPERIAVSRKDLFVDRWSRDGKLALFANEGQKTLLMTLQLDTASPPNAQGDPVQVAEGAPGSFSPDGHWLAYCDCGASGDRPTNVYIRHLQSGSEYQISKDGGSQPVWAASGRELFYWAASKLWAVDLVVDGSSVRIGRPQALFEGDYLDLGTPDYDVTADGRRFVMVRTANANTRQLPVRLHWTSELGRLASSAR